jgi:hypothetical protein
VRHRTTFAIAVAITAFTLVGHGADDENDPQSLWEGAGGLILPLSDKTPVRVDSLEASFTAIAPPKRTLEDPRFAEQWEVSTRMELTNSSAAPCTLTLGLPQRAAAEPDAPPAIDHVVISLDHKRMRVKRVDEPGPAIPGAPPTEIHHRVSVDFEPGQTRRVDTLFRTRAQFHDGATRFRFIFGGAERFAGGEIGRVSFEWHFGTRVRLVEEHGAKAAWVTAPPPGSKHWFFDDGIKTRLLLELEKLHPAATLELAAAVVGLGRDRSDPILGEMRPITSMSALELELARWTYLALHGRRFREPGVREVFEDRPWSDCNPAFRVAHGVKIEEPTLADFLAVHSCDESCISDRKLPVDPYGSAWKEPLCWYAPEHNLSLTRVVDPEIKKRIRAIEERIKTLAPAAVTPESEKPADSGCLCIPVGKRPGGRPRSSLLSLLLGALPGTGP